MAIELNESIKELFSKKLQFIHDVIAANSSSNGTASTAQLNGSSLIFAEVAAQTGHTSQSTSSTGSFTHLKSHTDWNGTEQQAIVIGINRIIKQKQLTLLPHHRLNWILIEKKDKKLYLYSVESTCDPNFLNGDDQSAIKNAYAPMANPLSKIIIQHSPVPKKLNNRFVFTVAYALCIASGQMFGTFFERLLDGDEDTSKIRELIVATLKNGQIIKSIGAANGN